MKITIPEFDSELKQFLGYWAIGLGAAGILLALIRIAWSIFSPEWTMVGVVAIILTAILAAFLVDEDRR